MTFVKNYFRKEFFLHGRHQNKERSLSADPDTQSDRREMEAEDLVAYSAGGQSILR